MRAAAGAPQAGVGGGRGVPRFPLPLLAGGASVCPLTAAPGRGVRGAAPPPQCVFRGGLVPARQWLRRRARRGFG